MDFQIKYCYICCTGGEYIASHNGTVANVTMVNSLPTISPSCVDGNKTYAIGEKIVRGCEEQCTCADGGKITECEPICQSPFFRSDKKISDPYCFARNLPENPCCAIEVCSDSGKQNFTLFSASLRVEIFIGMTFSAPEPEETCVFGNTTVSRGQKVEDGCTKTCICEAAGHLKCQPRCPPNDTASGINQHDRCVVLQDPR